MAQPTSNPNKLLEIANKFGLELIVLFGSRARGTFSTESDSDFGVRALKTLPKETLLDVARALDAVSPNAEVVDLREAGPLLLGAIAKDGKLLYESQTSLFAEFKIRAMNEYLDYQPYLDKLAEQNKQALKNLK